MSNPRLVQNDSYLNPHKDIIKNRTIQADNKRLELLHNRHESLSDFANGHLSFGCFRDNDNIIFREWLPNAIKVFLLGDFSKWFSNKEFAFVNLGNGVWELKVSNDIIKHGDLYKLKVIWDGGEGERIPAWSRRVVQDDDTKLYCAQVWLPKKSYKWKNNNKLTDVSPLIYEAHIGMSGEDEKVTTYTQFKNNTLPRIAKLGYNMVQLMAIQEHPYYGSFGYHVSSLFAASSRFGTPEELKDLIDTAHGLGIRVIMDIVHSHAVKNDLEGLGNYDGTRHQFFHEGERGEHPAWDSFCFNYGKNEVIHFLLSNIKFWLDEYKFDGFRFDGVTSMLYFDHGLGRDFTGYEYYFDGGQDDDAITYLMLANQLIKDVNPMAISVAEEMSGYPGIASLFNDGGVGFDYRLAMGIPDFWIKTLKEKRDEDWNLGQLFHELTSKRADEKTISYVESHDQALVGDKTIAFRLMGKEMYFKMLVEDTNLVVDRGIALHKMIRLITISTAGGGYLNFMGNEFGHPEWIDFPREGNGWSYSHAVRQWSLVDREDLKYKFLNKFDKELIKLVSNGNLLQIDEINVQTNNDADSIIAFSRSNLIFVFNFNPTQSFSDYGITVPEGKYKQVLCTDNLDFGGFGRYDETVTYFSDSIEPGKSIHQIKLYLPARSALVLEKKHTPSVFDR